MVIRIPRPLRPYQGFFLPVGVALVSIISFIVGVIPAISYDLARVNTLKELAGEVKTLTIKSQLLANLDEQELKDNLLLLTDAVPTTPSLPTVFATIEGLAADTGVAVGSVEILDSGVIATDSAKRQTADEKKIGAYLLPFAITVDGTYGNIKQYIGKLVSIRRFLRVRSFAISFPQEGGAKSRLELDAFYAPLPKGLGSQTMLSPLTSAEKSVIESVDAYKSYMSQAEQFLPSSSGGGKADPFSSN
jgi:Tfp pilus assembly protein PilO